MFAGVSLASEPSSLMDPILVIARHPISSFIPQMLATISAGFVIAWRYDLEFACFIQTIIFVTFNKVCTSQVSLTLGRDDPQSAQG